MFVDSSSSMFDNEFLKKLDFHPQREVYAKIISLTFDEAPITEITGKITAGSISVDGSSAVRRTCNITMVTDQVNINELDWALKTKFAVSIGLKNFIDPVKPDIIWFEQGIFIINTFSQSVNMQGYQIQIAGKDKMCMLDGTVGGALFASHDFGKIDVIGANKEITIQQNVPIYQIIRNAIRTYAQEPWHNIIINDLEDCAVELLDYKLNDRPAYIVDVSTDHNFATYECQMIFGNTQTALDYELEDIDAKNTIVILRRDGEVYHTKGTPLLFIRVIKVLTYGETAGYRETALTYAGDLVIEAGQPVTAMLDKVVQQLGEFEYFYDTQGRFVFQRKQVYYNQSWTNAITNDKGDTYYAQSSASRQTTYEFMRGNIVESFNNKPNMLNIKNDLTIWGIMSGVSDIEVPIHLRYAIDEKPTEYYSLRKQKLFTDKEYDWRELIYQMAWDNAKYQSHFEELTYALYNGYYHYDNKKLYTPEYKKYYCYDFEHKNMRLIKTADDLEEQLKKENFIFGKVPLMSVKETLEQELALWESTWNTGYDAYYADMLSFWREIYKYEEQDFMEMNAYNEELEVFNAEEFVNWFNNKYWNPHIFYYNRTSQEIEFNNPGALKFWLEFIDVNSSLGKYRVSLIGRRSKVINDNEIKAIFYRETPGVLFIDPTSNTPQDSNISYAKLNLVGGLTNYFSISAQGKSAKEAMDNLLYETTYYQESITLQCLPIYYLSPNTRIRVEDDRTGIRGEYLVKSFNFQLTHDGMMSITATRAADRLI